MNAYSKIDDSVVQASVQKDAIELTVGSIDLSVWTIGIFDSKRQSSLDS